jgi:hypothetical protein
MRRLGFLVSAGLVFAIFGAVTVASVAQETKQEKKTTTTKTTTKPRKMVKRSNAWKIQNAMSAAPPAVSKAATIMDFPPSEGAEMPVLRPGTNGWTCLPDMPETPANDPMCMDKMAMQWAGAWMGHKDPSLASNGIGYMLQGGGSASNSDPFAMKPTAGETWMKEPPHVMLFPAGGKIDSSVYGSDPKSGGPWIMWGGTPYEHLMVPVK